MNILKANLAHYIPSLVELIDGNDFPWDKIDRMFTKKLNERIQLLSALQESLKIEASIYDVIVQVKKDNPLATGLLDYFNQLFKELLEHLTPAEKLLIRSNAKLMLKNFDSKYLNFLGEMAVLNTLIKSKAYHLIEIEHKLSNGKSVDFMLHQKISKKVVLVEIVNIHINPDKVENDPIAIEKFLTGKLQPKMADKKLNLKEPVEIYLVPVLWGPWQQIKIYTKFYKGNQIELEGVLEPLAYLQYKDSLNNHTHYFKPVSLLFEREA